MNLIGAHIVAARPGPGMARAHRGPFRIAPPPGPGVDTVEDLPSVPGSRRQRLQPGLGLGVVSSSSAFRVALVALCLLGVGSLCKLSLAALGSSWYHPLKSNLLLRASGAERCSPWSPWCWREP